METFCKIETLKFGCVFNFIEEVKVQKETASKDNKPIIVKMNMEGKKNRDKR